ncbi:hypothetical protein [Limobrevibacterium gyesilva]|uniref:Lipoprotein n=1 Tax=Limobrevibacterium gyesilva TaxID=2991712 RepID=A0AA41YQ75_9PROT|nr:hypothetical protein [Limobrevibacterium gyesilva]MCW3473517.1 hypothetical protein [Limobrevibacterium gyesilva]
MRILAAIALSASLLTAACTTPDGRFDAGNTLALTAGLAALGGIAYLATRDDGDRHQGYGNRHGYGQRYGGGGHMRGRGW